MAVEVRLLGPVELVVDADTVVLAGVRPRAVLAVLAASAGAPVPSDRLAETVYSDTGRPATRTTVQVHVHTVRQALGTHGGALRHTPAGYLLAGVEVDLRTAEDALARGRAADRAGDVPGAAAGYRSALSLWRGPFCADLPDHNALDPARTLYAELRWEALEARIAADLRACHAPGLVRELEALVAENPLRERLWGQLMVALYRDSRQADALAVFQQARRVLAEEAGLDPGPALRDLERAILAHSGVSTLLPVVAPVTATPADPALSWVDSSGRARRRSLPRTGRLTIGRDPTADIALLHDRAVSRAHAAVIMDTGRPVAVDLNSRNGTFHNGEPIPADGVPPQPRRPPPLRRHRDRPDPRPHPHPRRRHNRGPRLPTGHALKAAFGTLSVPMDAFRAFQRRTLVDSPGHLVPAQQFEVGVGPRFAVVTGHRRGVLAVVHDE